MSGFICASGEHFMDAELYVCGRCGASGMEIVARQGGGALRTGRYDPALERGYPKRDEGFESLTIQGDHGPIKVTTRLEPLPMMDRVVPAMTIIGELARDHELVARALFVTDERLLQLVERVCDAYVELPAGSDFDQVVDFNRVRSALDKAWERDEFGVRTTALERALVALAALRGTSTDFYGWSCATAEGAPPSATHARARDLRGDPFCPRDVTDEQMSVWERRARNMAARIAGAPRPPNAIAAALELGPERGDPLRLAGATIDMAPTPRASLLASLRAADIIDDEQYDRLRKLP